MPSPSTPSLSLLLSSSSAPRPLFSPLHIHLLELQGDKLFVYPNCLCQYHLKPYTTTYSIHIQLIETRVILSGYEGFGMIYRREWYWKPRTCHHIPVCYSHQQMGNPRYRHCPNNIHKKTLLVQHWFQHATSLNKH